MLVLHGHQNGDMDRAFQLGDRPHDNRMLRQWSALLVVGMRKDIHLKEQISEQLGGNRLSSHVSWMVRLDRLEIQRCLHPLGLIRVFLYWTRAWGLANGGLAQAFLAGQFGSLSLSGHVVCLYLAYEMKCSHRFEPKRLDDASNLQYCLALFIPISCPDNAAGMKSQRWPGFFYLHHFLFR